MRSISMAVVLVLVVGGALSLGSGAARSSASATPTVVISVTGHAPKGVTISYGHDVSPYHGKFPMHQTMAYSDNYANYWVSARLKNGGKITCSVKVGSVTKTRHAQGGHKLCAAQLHNAGNSVWR
jgi:hypothetical protein